jgi:hypothetical protein
MNKPEAADSWSALLGDAWAEMLRGLPLGPSGTVVEIGPGFTDKVARALAALDFRGLVVLVEPNVAAAAWASESYRRRLPRAEIRVVTRPLPDGKILAGRRVDALLANHVLDDLILNAALPPDASAEVFASMTAGSACSRTFVGAWRGLLSRSGALARLTSAVAEHFTNYVEEMRPRFVMLNQYPSWRHETHGLGSIHTHALSLMGQLESSLGAACVDSAVSPDAGGSCPVRWLLAGRD